MKAIIAAVIIAASPGLACAESWVLWQKTTSVFTREDRGPTTVGLHETKAACLTAAKEKAARMYVSRLELERNVAARSLSGSRVAIPQNEYEAREPGLLKNGQGYVTALTLDGKASVTDSRSYFFFAECWPVGVNPQ